MTNIDTLSLLGRKYIFSVISITTAITILYSTHKFVSSASNDKQKKEKSQIITEIPTPGSCYPYVGHMLALGDAPSKKLVEWHKELGPIIKVHMGKQIWVLVDDPELAHRIFVTHGAETSFRPYSTYASEHYSFRGK